MSDAIKSEPFILNIGPQHPSTHGVFRIKALVDGEKRPRCRNGHGLPPPLDGEARRRAHLHPEHPVHGPHRLPRQHVEQPRLLPRGRESWPVSKCPARGDAIRVIMAELQRLASHCMAVGAFSNDTGAWQTPVMWSFREREKILDIFEDDLGRAPHLQLHAHRRRRLRPAPAVRADGPQGPQGLPAVHRRDRGPAHRERDLPSPARAASVS